MSLFQCQVCGCLENTACASQGFTGIFTKLFDWSYAPEREGLKLCSVCGSLKYKDGTSTPYGKWHNRFKYHYLPKNEFFTNEEGNLEHAATGSTNVIDFAYNADEIKYSPEYDIFGKIVAENKLPDTDFIFIPRNLWELTAPYFLFFGFDLNINRSGNFDSIQLHLRQFNGKYEFSFSGETEEQNKTFSLPLDAGLLYTSNLRMVIQYFRRMRDKEEVNEIKK